MIAQKLRGDVWALAEAAPTYLEPTGRPTHRQGRLGPPAPRQNPETALPPQAGTAPLPPLTAQALRRRPEPWDASPWARAGGGGRRSRARDASPRLRGSPGRWGPSATSYVTGRGRSRDGGSGPRHSPPCRAGGTSGSHWPAASTWGGTSRRRRRHLKSGRASREAGHRRVDTGEAGTSAVEQRRASLGGASARGLARL